jgi:hypothetical protein
MTAESFAHTLASARKMMSRPAATFALALTAAFSLLPIVPLRAQAPTAAPGDAVQAPPPSATPANPQDLTGTWQGTLHAGQDLRIILKITKADAGGYKSSFYSIDQTGNPFPIDKTTQDGSAVKFTVPVIGGTYEGKMSADGKTIVGNWTQGPTPMPLTLIRATPETEWTIPTPPTPTPASTWPPSSPANPASKAKASDFRPVTSAPSTPI